MESPVALRRPVRAGFTLVEMLIVIVLAGILTAVALPRFRDVLASSRLSRVSRAVASDLDVGISLAGRQRRPVRIECDCPNRILRVVDRATGTVLHQRALGGTQDLSVGSMTLAASDGGTSVVVFPNGLASAQLTVLLDESGRTRTVTLALSGAVRSS
jgi:prepilin-type N-terminal cleavage/methylation domain-containing protein